MVCLQDGEDQVDPNTGFSQGSSLLTSTVVRRSRSNTERDRDSANNGE